MSKIEQNTVDLQEILNAINNLPEAGEGEGGGREPVVEPLTVTKNDTYTPPEGIDGFNPVTVNVPDRFEEGYQQGVTDSALNLVPLNATENKEYTPEGEVDGYSSVTVNVPLRYDEGYAVGKQDGYNEGYQASQNSIVLQEKTATQNGEYEADTDNGYTALSKVTVNVTDTDTVNGWGVEVILNGSDPEEITKPTLTFVCTAG